MNDIDQAISDISARMAALKTSIATNAEKLAALERGEGPEAQGTVAQWLAGKRDTQARIDADRAALATADAELHEAGVLAEGRRAAIRLGRWSHAVSEAQAVAKRGDNASEAAIDALRRLLFEETRRQGYPSSEVSGQLCRIGERLPPRNYSLTPEPQAVTDARGVWCVMIDMYEYDPSNPLSFDEASAARDEIVRLRRANAAAE